MTATARDVDVFSDKTTLRTLADVRRETVLDALLDAAANDSCALTLPITLWELPGANTELLLGVNNESADDLLEVLSANGLPASVGHAGTARSFKARPVVSVSEQRSIILYVNQKDRIGKNQNITVDGRCLKATVRGFRWAASPNERAGDESELSAFLRKKKRAELQELHWLRLADGLSLWVRQTTGSAMPGTYEEAARFVEKVVGIQVYEAELPGEEAGRLAIQFRNLLKSGAVSIVIDTNRSPHKLFALFHELGHFAHHFAFLMVMSRLYHQICAVPPLEGAVADFLDSGAEQSLRLLHEMQADMFAARCLLGDELHLAGSMASEPQDYPVDSDVSKRLAWCVRNWSAWADVGRRVTTTHQQLVNLLGGDAYTIWPKPTVPFGSSGTFIRRISLSQVDDWIRLGDRWEPSIVQIDGVASPSFYVPLIGWSGDGVKLQWRYGLDEEWKASKTLPEWVELTAQQRAWPMLFPDPLFGVRGYGEEQ